MFDKLFLSWWLSKFCFQPIYPSSLKTCMYKYFFNIFPWMTSRYHNLNISKNQISDFPPATIWSSYHYPKHKNWNVIFLFNYMKNFEVYFLFQAFILGWPKMLVWVLMFQIPLSLFSFKLQENVYCYWFTHKKITHKCFPTSQPISNPHLLHCRQTPYHLEPPGKAQL